MRILFSLLTSVFVVISLFYLIIGLIHQDVPLLEAEEALVRVNIESVKKEKDEKAPKPKKKTDIEPEPILKSEIDLSIAPSVNNSNQPLINLSTAQTDFQFQSKDIPRFQENWIQPKASSQSGAKALGEEIGSTPEALRKVIPISTRQPQIPKIAWENKINGWVLVSLEVKPSGRTENIQVLDAYPRGVFEDEAVAAVSSWLYETYTGSNRRLLQKIEFQWKYYPYNWE
ncbi:MAG: TonB family protein [Bermanella sp.]